MKRVLPVIAAAAVILTAACASRSDLTRPAAQDDFGVQMAKMNLWREAMFRFKRAVEINPADAKAHNNLAVAYEANGDFENARKEYLEALKLDRSNSYVQKNYSRFVEFLSRNRKRQQTREASALPPLRPAAGAKGGIVDTAPPGRPIGTEAPRPVPPPSDQPPPQPVPPTPPTMTPQPATPPPGGVR